MAKNSEATKMTMVTLLMASMLILMGGAAIAPALPAISEVFPDASEFTVSLIITLPSLAVAIFGMVMGYLADRVGKVRILILSLLILAISGMSGYFLNNLTAILVGRFLLGIGIGGLTSTTTALISEHWSGRQRLKILGYQAAANGLGALVLETSGGILAGISWRYPFLIYGLGFLLTVMTVLFVGEPNHLRSDHVQKERRPMRMPIIILCYLTIFMTMVLMFALPTKLTYFLVEIGYDSTAGGILLGLFGAVNAAIGAMYGRVATRLDAYASFVLGFAMIAVAYLLFYADAGMVTIVISMILMGSAMGTIIPAVTSTLVQEVSGPNSGKVMGGYGTFLSLGQFISGFVLMPVIDIAGGYRMMYVALGALSVVLVLLYIVIRFAVLRKSRC